MSKTVAIVQSNYIPWKGYFDMIHSVDEFILYDDVQYTKRDWRNRNLIKGPQGLQWLTIPVLVKGKFTQAIKDTVVAEPDWGKKHWNALVTSYAKAPYFKQYKEQFEALYLHEMPTALSEINLRFIKKIVELLGIRTKISFSMDYEFPRGDQNEQLISLCEKAGATAYVSGPAASVYLDKQAFANRGIAVSYFEYAGYPEYEQRFPPFEHGVSILDLLFNQGPEAPRFMKSFQNDRR